MKVVVDTGNPGREVLGIFLRRDGDFVLYNDWEDGALCDMPSEDIEIASGKIEFHGPGGLVEISK